MAGFCEYGNEPLDSELLISLVVLCHKQLNVPHYLINKSKKFAAVRIKQIQQQLQPCIGLLVRSARWLVVQK